MILPMKKVCLMVQQNKQNEALLKLREVGLVHIEKSVPQDSVSKSVERKAKIESAIGLLSEIKVSKNKKPVPQTAANVPRNAGSSRRRGRRSVDIFGTEEQEPYSLDAVQGASRPYLPDLIISINRERKALQDRSSYLGREIARIKPWGEFEPSSIKELSVKLPVFLYELTHEAFSAIDKDVRFIVVNSNKAVVRLLVFDAELPGLSPMPLPEKSLSALLNEVDEIKLDIEEIDARLRTFTDRVPALRKEMESVEKEIEFDNASAVMETVDDIPAELGLCYLTGYVPAEDMYRLKTASSENGWALSVVDPDDADEAVPTKLKNSKFVNLLNPITDFLGIVPGYREVDISLWFLLFFCIFFGMIFGDAAYGIILSLIAFFGILKTAKKGVPLPLKMLLLLGIFNTAWGVITCSWFGVDPQKVPEILQKISLSYFSTVKTPSVLVDQNLQIFCFSLGLIQLTIAHLMGIIRYRKSLRVFAEIGSIAMLWGMFNVVLFLVVSKEERPIPLLPASVYMLGGGFILTFIFASYEGSILQSILSSCKNIISVVLGITNVFSDIMSYIRLWAVGLAGASIATTVNTMAGPLLGNFLIFAGIILLVFGHGLNIILNVLSVLVHGVRLNTLEFSSHVGLSWSGMAYRPFAEKK